LPHKCDLIRSNVISESSCLNQEPLLFEGFKSISQIPVKISGEGVELTVLKKAEKEESWVLRLVETHGRISNASLNVTGKIIECDLIEWENSGIEKDIKDEMQVELKPFEIKTFKLKM
jgi:alpha-mannosidase